MALCFALATAGCGSSGANSGGDLGAGDAGGDFAAGVDLAGAACPLGADTTPSSTVTNGCARLVRDTSACNAARAAQGLTGAWLEFSCRVTLTHVTGAASYVQASSDSRPDYASNYFTTGDACWVAYTPAFPDPNTITVQSLSIKAPDAPDTAGAAMGLGPVGIAVNGVAIFDNQAAPGDDIFTEASSFDRCGGHPAPGGEYHYHGEPYAISYDDANLIGVLRDGYFVYGRRDAGGSLPTGLDAHGGHVAATPDSATPVYHYHLTQQTSTSSGTLGQMQWFLTTGTYEGTPLP
ncbi:MAG TPA: YHYH protein [Polyangia bacterium]|nr:YHYH protein [Polyangia bacterium]